MPTFTLFDIGRSALLAARRGMDTTGHNVANSATPGYSRQETRLEPIIQRQGLLSGVGVRVTGIARSRDVFIDAVLRDEMGTAAGFSVQKDVMDQIQVIVAEPSDNSIRATVDDFWSAWHDLSVAPGSSSARAQVMERGRSLADMFRHVGGQLDSLAKDTECAIDAAVGRTNLLIQRVAGLNLEISRAMARQEPAADLMDQRDLLLDEISELTGATVTYLQDGGSVRVSVGGFPLLDKEVAYSLEARYLSSGTEFRWVSAPGESVPISSMGGCLGGYQVARDHLALGFRSELECFLRSIVDNVNSIHRDGFPKTGSPSDFFQFDPGTYLSSVAVAPEIVKDPNTICASKIPGDATDGSVALRIADRLGGEDPPLEGVFADTWAGMIGRLGAIGQKVQSGCDVQGILVKELQNRKDSVSGVSVDEEIATLLRQQHAFNAASRLVTVADEALDTIVNRMGITGR